MDKPHTVKMSILDEQGEEKVVATVKSDIIDQVNVWHNIDALSLMYKQLLEEYKKFN